jgi:hypothetical protein
VQKRSRRRALLAAFAALGAGACGASVSQVYESDVRFERCLALDWQNDVRSDVRRKCWDDWVSYFNVGQPKDRIEYARKQIALIDRGGVSEVADDKGALPEPTSVFAPVPMMITTPTFGSAGPATSAAPSAQKESSPCEAKCDKSLEGCLSGCRTPVCEQYCAQKHGRCAQRCVDVDDRR